MKDLGKILLLSFFMIVSVASVAANGEEKATFTAASYNLRQANHSDSVRGDGWGRRLPVLTNLIRFHGFDIFGTQEGFRHQLDSLVKRLPGYAFTGVGRDDGKAEGEHSAIFYRTDLFDLIDHGDFWLSETPDKPGLGWDAACVRICSWGKFRHKPTGREFLFFNLHLDHVGTKARTESALLVRSKFAEIAPGIPAIVTGDFNVDQTSPAYRTMIKSGDLLDSHDVAAICYDTNGTFNNYRTDEYTPSRIDHVFVTPDVEVLKYGILTDTYRTDDKGSVKATLMNAPDEISAVRVTPRTPSDHFPVMTVISL